MDKPIIILSMEWFIADENRLPPSKLNGLRRRGAVLLLNVV